MGLIHGWEDPLEEEKAPHSSSWVNLMEKGAWQTTVYEVTESDMSEHA